MVRIGIILFYLMVLGFSSCNEQPLNNPQKPAQKEEIVFHASFSESPKTLDPARSYSSNESLFTAQIYQPVLQYHYLKRPYQLQPLTAAHMPTIQYLNRDDQVIGTAGKSQHARLTNTGQIAKTRYMISIRPNILYQPHPAFSCDKNGKLLYHHLSKKEIGNKATLNDFKKKGTRELKAVDYVYQIKRLADPRLNSPILSVMEKYIVGLKPYATLLRHALKTNYKKDPQGFNRYMRDTNIAGVNVLGPYTYQIDIKGLYPQFKYWLAMPFFSPMPWEVVEFYSQPGMRERNLSLSWFPVGTGPYMLTENNPNREMVLSKNPYYRGYYYPSTGNPGDRAKGYLNAAGKSLPFIDKFVFSLEKETIPRWNKFMQGYYDNSTISSDNFGQAIQIDANGKPQLTEELKQKGIRLTTSVRPGIFYFGFNMLDPVVGGHSKKARELRQAISLALNYEEYISIFLNGRGIPAQGPLPPGIFGHLDGKAGINPLVYAWKQHKAVRHRLAQAKRLLAKAGYPNGRNIKTGKPLLLHYDVPAGGSPDDKATLNWMRKQFAKLGIQLNIRATQYNRFQEKMRTGNAQMFSWGWLADYPDPENFLFLLYGPNGKVKFHGENAANYHNAEFDRLFDRMKTLPNGPERQSVINKMVAIVRHDAPWVFGFIPKDFVLTQRWLAPSKPNAMANNTLQYLQLDPKLRSTLQHKWNKPIIWPLILFCLLLFALLLPVFIKYRQKTHQAGKDTDSC